MVLPCTVVHTEHCTTQGGTIPIIIYVYGPDSGHFFSGTESWPSLPLASCDLCLVPKTRPLLAILIIIPAWHSQLPEGSSIPVAPLSVSTILNTGTWALAMLLAVPSDFSIQPWLPARTQLHGTSKNLLLMLLFPMVPPLPDPRLSCGVVPFCPRFVWKQRRFPEFSST